MSQEMRDAVTDGLSRVTQVSAPLLRTGDIIGVELDARVWEDVTLTFWRNGVKCVSAPSFLLLYLTLSTLIDTH